MTAGRRNTVEDKQKERRDDNLANRRLLRRTLILMAICGVLIFIPVLAKLWNLKMLPGVLD